MEKLERDLLAVGLFVIHDLLASGWRGKSFGSDNLLLSASSKNM